MNRIFLLTLITIFLFSCEQQSDKSTLSTTSKDEQKIRETAQRGVEALKEANVEKYLACYSEESRNELKKFFETPQFYGDFLYSPKEAFQLHCKKELANSHVKYGKVVIDGNKATLESFEVVDGINKTYNIPFVKEGEQWLFIDENVLEKLIIAGSPKPKLTPEEKVEKAATAFFDAMKAGDIDQMSSSLSNTARAAFDKSITTGNAENDKMMKEMMSKMLREMLVSATIELDKVIIKGSSATIETTIKHSGKVECDTLDLINVNGQWYISELFN